MGPSAGGAAIDEEPPLTFDSNVRLSPVLSPGPVCAESAVCFYSCLSAEVSGTPGVGGLGVWGEGACEQEPPTFTPKVLPDPEPLKVRRWPHKTSDPRPGTVHRGETLGTPGTS